MCIRIHPGLDQTKNTATISATEIENMQREFDREDLVTSLARAEYYRLTWKGFYHGKPTNLEKERFQQSNDGKDLNKNQEKYVKLYLQSLEAYKTDYELQDDDSDIKSIEKEGELKAENMVEAKNPGWKANNHQLPVPSRD